MSEIKSASHREPLPIALYATLRVALGLLLIIIVAAFPPGATAQPTPSDLGLNTMLDLINEERSVDQQCGDTTYESASPLVWSNDLETAATNHAKDMVARDFFSHDNPDGESAGDRILRINSGFNHIAENIARGQSNAEQVVQSWMNSPGHCANVMNSRFTKVGAGVAMGTMERDGNSWDAPFWTLKLGRDAEGTESAEMMEEAEDEEATYEAQPLALDQDAMLQRLTELRQNGYSCSEGGRPSTANHVLEWHDGLERWATSNSSRIAERNRLEVPRGDDRKIQYVFVEAKDEAFDRARMTMEQGPTDFESALLNWLSDRRSCSFIFNSYNTHIAISASVRTNQQTGEPEEGAHVYWTLIKGIGTPLTMQDELAAFFSGKSIELYGRTRCGLTQRMHRELTALGIQHEPAFYEGWEGPNFDKKRAARRQANETVRGAQSLPTLIIGDTAYTGFSTVLALYRAMQAAE